ncbi:hypothetical protein TYRP_017521 [Tyrophagus putrescentiae]|nr:hypothetical protein TYRP_017521 [Tyrophagus putrescentiae]
MAYEIMFLVSSLGLVLLALLIIAVFAFVCYLKCCSSNAGREGGGGEWGYFADDQVRIPARGKAANLFMQNNNKHNNNTASQDTTDCSRPTTSEKEAAGRGGDLSDAELSQMFQPYVSADADFKTIQVLY